VTLLTFIIDEFLVPNATQQAVGLKNSLKAN